MQRCDVQCATDTVATSIVAGCSAVQLARVDGRPPGEDGRCLVDLLDLGATAAAAAAHVAVGHSARHAAAAAAAGGVEFLDDGRADTLDLLLLVRELLLIGHLVLLEPLDRVGDGLERSLDIVGVELLLHLVVSERGLDLVAVVLERVLRFNSLLKQGVLIRVLLRLDGHLLDVFLGEARFVVGDGLL
mmetsp:Transcript_11928/g.31165  ORF Transcript_11928/g.31165 Transcript_11928/m.31165 type:complete len:188 (-) Transcript_11928:1310-1873(-)